MKKFLSLTLAFVCILMLAVSSTACFNKKTPYKNRISQTLPEAFQMEFQTNYGYYRFSKVGNNYYVFNAQYGSPVEIFLQENLPSQFTEVEQHFRTYTYFEDAWHIAETWQDNDRNRYDRLYNVKGIYGRISEGISSINADEKGTSYVQKDNETLTIGENQVECVVYEHVYDDGDLYAHYKYWYEKNSKLLIKSASCFDRNGDVDAEDPDFIAIKFETENLTMESILGDYELTTVGLPI